MPECDGAATLFPHLVGFARRRRGLVVIIVAGAVDVGKVPSDPRNKTSMSDFSEDRGSSAFVNDGRRKHPSGQG